MPFANSGAAASAQIDDDVPNIGLVVEQAERAAAMLVQLYGERAADIARRVEAVSVVPVFARAVTRALRRAGG